MEQLIKTADDFCFSLHNLSDALEGLGKVLTPIFEDLSNREIAADVIINSSMASWGIHQLQYYSTLHPNNLPNLITLIHRQLTGIIDYSLHFIVVEFHFPGK